MLVRLSSKATPADGREQSFHRPKSLQPLLPSVQGLAWEWRWEEALRPQRQLAEACERWPGKEGTTFSDALAAFPGNR
jgi:hypothetical protein